MHVRNLMITLVLAASAGVVTANNPAYALTPGQATTPATPAPTTSTATPTTTGAPKVSDVIARNPDIGKWGKGLLTAPVECYGGSVVPFGVCTKTHWDGPTNRAGCDDIETAGAKIDYEWNKQAGQCVAVQGGTDSASSAALAGLGLRVKAVEKKTELLDTRVTVIEATDMCQTVALGGTLPAGFTATRDAMNGQVEVKDAAGAIVCSGTFTALVETRAVGLLATNAQTTADTALAAAGVAQTDLVSFRTAQTTTNAGFVAGITQAQSDATLANNRAATLEEFASATAAKFNSGKYGLFQAGAGVISAGGHTGPGVQAGWGLEGTYGGFVLTGNFGLLSEYSDAYSFAVEGYLTPVPVVSIGARVGYLSLGVGSTDADGSAEVIVNGMLASAVLGFDFVPEKPNGFGLELAGGLLAGQADVLKTGTNDWGYGNGGGVTTAQFSGMLVYRFGGKTKNIAWSPYAVSAPVAPAPATSTAAPAGSPPPM